MWPASDWRSPVSGTNRVWLSTIPSGRISVTRAGKVRAVGSTNDGDCGGGPLDMHIVL